MLDVLRKSSGSWVIKILFVLLILSFGVWGVGDVVRGLATDRVAIKVGDIEYDPTYVAKQFSRQVEQFRGMFGPSFNADSAKQLGMLDSTVAGIVSSATQQMAAKDLGLVVSEDGLRQAIVEQPAFRGPDGKFDKDLYQRTLMSNNLTEDMYVKMIRPDLTVRRLTGSVEANAAAPRILAETLYRYQKETRSGEALVVSARAQVLDKTATEDELKAVYETNAARFMAPETRAISVLLLRSEDMTGRADVSDAEVESHYAANKDQYAIPETRDVSQVLIDSEEAAKAVIAAAKTPADLEKASATVKSSVFLPMGAVSRDSLPGETAEAVLALAVGQISAPVQSPLGWHVFGVSAIHPAGQKAFADVKAEIRAELLRAKAEEALYQIARQAEDELASGAGFPAAAKKLSLPLIDVTAVTDKGMDASGKLVTTLPDAMREQILASAFSLQAGEESRLEQTPAGQFLLRVNAVTPAAQRPLDSVRAEAVALWEEGARKAKAEAVAQSLTEQAKAGKPLSALADPAKGITLAAIPAVTRDGAAGATTLPRPMVQKLFAMAVNDTAMVPGDAGSTVLRLNAITAADPAKDQAGVAAVAATLKQEGAADLTDAVTEGFGTRFKTVVKRDLIDQAL